MKMRLCLWFVLWAWWLAGCAVQPAVPSWRLAWQQAVEQWRTAELEGRTRAAALHWQRAQQAARSAADAQALARLALMQCALRLAAAQTGACPQAAPYLEDSDVLEHAYAAWLAGAMPTIFGADRRWGQDMPVPAAPSALSVLGTQVEPAQGLAVLQNLHDPLSRLVAGGWLWQAGRLDQQGVALLVDTAAAQGWRRPLAAWLTIQQHWAEQTGDTGMAARARRRLQWLTSPAALAD